MRIAREAVVDGTPAEVWRTVGDPHHLPRWWPGVERVENVDRRGFTQVLRSSRGVLVRADYLRGDRVEARRISWRQQLEGTPFEKFLSSHETRVLLESEAGAGDRPRTRVRIEFELELGGKARFGGLLFRRAARRQQGQALEALTELCHAA